MSSKSKRRRPRGIPGYRPGELMPFTLEEVSAILLDGFDCPYCARRVLANPGGLLVCECGWSGAFGHLCDDPSCTA